MKLSISNNLKSLLSKREYLWGFIAFCLFFTALVSSQSGMDFFSGVMFLTAIYWTIRNRGNSWHWPRIGLLVFFVVWFAVIALGLTLNPVQGSFWDQLFEFRWMIDFYVFVLFISTYSEDPRTLKFFSLMMTVASAMAIYQTVLRKKIGFHFVRQFSWVKYRQLMSEGAWLSLVVFLTAVQVRIVSALSAERMSPEIFGNFQLIVKLVEPATAIGAIIFAANYTVLAHTLNKQREVFNARFLKISLLSVGISVLCGVFICVFPTSLLLRVFGAAYSSGLNNLWMGFGIILANVVLTISVQRNMILRLYLPVVLKYGGIFVCYVLLFWEMDAVSLQAALLAQFVVPILVVLGVDAFVFLSNKIRGHSR
jgi:O-antigen/teichoic acid export membrane protein